MSKIEDAGIGGGGGFFSSFLTGFGVLLGMLTLKSVFPAASIVVPSVPASIADSAKGFLLIGSAPLFEEPFFRGAFYNWLRRKGLSDRQANAIQAVFFGVFHTLAYGLVLGQLDSVIVAFGAFTAILGSILAATLFGYAMRIVVNRTMRNGGTPNLLPAMIIHAGLNAAIFLSLAVVF